MTASTALKKYNCSEEPRLEHSVQQNEEDHKKDIEPMYLAQDYTVLFHHLIAVIRINSRDQRQSTDCLFYFLRLNNNKISYIQKYLKENSLNSLYIID
jgi:hypothetical protein